MGQRFCLTLDLVDDAAAIAACEDLHRPGNVPPGVVASIRNAGIGEMEIFRIGNRLVMIIDASDDFSFERKAAMDAADPAVIDWEERMLEYQCPRSDAPGAEKWERMPSIFRLTDQPS
ncbi:L-rhamnose mutarotase [Sphingomonas oryzagri]